MEDLLRLVSSGTPGLSGSVRLHLKVDLPPGRRRFLEKLRITGEIGIGEGRFTTPETQQGLERISRNAGDRQGTPSEVVSNLKGRVVAAGGLATLSGVTFSVPGASAEMSGTYQLIEHRVDLHGTAHLEEKLSKTTTGVKSLLLKLADPFFRKKKHLSVVPVRISGTYGNTSIQLDLSRRRKAR
jgi:hypothetical protein